MDFGLREHTAVVAGGTRGIGRSVAESLAAEGCRVAVLARNEARLNETEQALVEAGAPDAIGLRCDLLDTGEVEASFTFLEERWGELNVLVNAAGPSPIAEHEEPSDSDWLNAFDSGVLTMVRTVRAALPLLRKASFARVVNIAASVIRHPSPGLVGFTAAKAAMAAASKNLSHALAHEGIVVNTVCPGFVMTPQLEVYVEDAQDDVLADGPLEAAYEIIEREFGAGNDLDRIGLPEEIAPVVTFLCSEQASFVLGATIPVDGGSDFF